MDEAEIRRRADAATAGPWSCLQPILLVRTTPAEDGGRGDGWGETLGLMVGDGVGACVVLADDGPLEEEGPRMWADADFIARARTDVPALLDRVAELRAVLAPLLDAEHHWTPRTLSRRIDGHGRILEGWGLVCMFCRRGPEESHAPDCAVLRRDALLGR